MVMQKTRHRASRTAAGLWGLAACAGIALALGAGHQSQLQEPPPASLPQPPTDEEREAIVTLRDGQRYTGILVSRDEKSLVLKIAGISTTLKANQVDRVQILAPINEQYRKMRAAIDDKDVERLLLLVEWLRSKSQWDSALVEVNHILEIQPDSGEAERLKGLIEAQKELAAKSGGGKRPPPPKVKPHEDANAGGDFPLLSDHDVNLIKVYEVNLTDPPRMFIDRDTIKTMIEQHVGDPLIPASPEARDALYRASPAKLLDMMFKMQARNLYDRVRVIDQPRSMKLFRDKVHRGWLENSCATTRCHGGSQAGRLMLATEKPGSDATVYTNFLILDRFKLHDGKALINYDDPAKSPLLQMAMIKERSAYRHPDVQGEQGRADTIRPVFRSEDDPRFTDALDWIKAMYRPRPQYPVEYTPPGPQGVPPEDPKAAPTIR